MTLDEYQTQRALGSLTEAEIHKIAGAEDTPIETLQYIRDERTRQGQACLTDDHHMWLNSSYGTAAKDKDEHMSYYVNQMIQCGVVIIDSSVNKEEYEIQDALGQLPALLKTMPLKINEAMVAFVGLSTNDIHESVQKSIDAYHRTHNITCPSLPK